MIEDVKAELCNRFHKDDCYITDCGTSAIVSVLASLESVNVVGIPSFTCGDILTAVTSAGKKFLVFDSGINLNINMADVGAAFTKGLIDAVIVPHMFGIEAYTHLLRFMVDQGDRKLIVIEDCAQCFGLLSLGKYSDYVVTSFGSSKWLPIGEGGAILSDWKRIIKIKQNRDEYVLSEEKLIKLQKLLDNADVDLKLRTMIAEQVSREGKKLFGTVMGADNAWLRGVYYDEVAPRLVYMPLHKIVKSRYAYDTNIDGERIKCPVIDKLWNKLNWVSIYPNMFETDEKSIKK